MCHVVNQSLFSFWWTFYKTTCPGSEITYLTQRKWIWSWTPFGHPERVQRKQINKLWDPQGNPKWILEDSKIPYWHPWSTLMESHGKPLKSIRGSWSDPTGIIEKSYVELVDPMLGNDASFEKPRALYTCHWLDDSQTNPENPNWFLNNVRCSIDGDPSIPQGHV